MGVCVCVCECHLRRGIVGAMCRVTVCVCVSPLSGIRWCNMSGSAVRHGDETFVLGVCVCVCVCVCMFACVCVCVVGDVLLMAHCMFMCMCLHSCVCVVIRDVQLGSLYVYVYVCAWLCVCVLLLETFYGRFVLLRIVFGDGREHWGLGPEKYVFWSL